MLFISDLRAQLEIYRTPSLAEPMSKYMKNKFPFFGIKAVQRKQLLRETINQHKTEVKEHTEELAKLLFGQEERECHYCGMELYARFKKKHYKTGDIEDIIFLLTTNSHWDTVDFIAKHILGQFLLEYPNQRTAISNQFSKSADFWLNRAAILFQLGYKSQTDTQLLFQICKAHLNSDEFFIKKAIGWALREYSKTNPEAVIAFTKAHTLKPLSTFEALRLIK
jgi:3-methyladenine DNA glycosylase AlkD